MHFLFASCFLLGANLYAFQKGLKTTPKTFPGIFIAFLHLILVQVYCVAFTWTLVVSPVHDTTDWFVASVFVLGLGSLILFGWRLFSTLKIGGPRSSWRTWLTLWAALTGGYVLFTASDHWWFFGESEQAGLADAEALGVPDIDCDRMVITNFEEGAANWRCPMGVAIGGALSGRVFIPWPAYSEGSSVELKKAIERVVEDATPR